MSIARVFNTMAKWERTYAQIEMTVPFEFTSVLNWAKLTCQAATQNKQSPCYHCLIIFIQLNDDFKCMSNLYDLFEYLDSDIWHWIEILLIVNQTKEILWRFDVDKSVIILHHLKCTWLLQTYNAQEPRAIKQFQIFSTNIISTPFDRNFTVTQIKDCFLYIIMILHFSELYS